MTRYIKCDCCGILAADQEFEVVVADNERLRSALAAASQAIKFKNPSAARKIIEAAVTNDQRR